MRSSSRRSRFAWLVLLSLLGAALVSPVIEVGDLIEGTLSAPRAGAHDHRVPDQLAHGGEPACAPASSAAFLVVGQYVSLGPCGMPGPVLEPVACLFAFRPAPTSLSHAGRRHLDRGPPLTA